mmetsp:Transcript_35749/g.76323  ORF Transcript_35749/g.76323 Transcript_35749/m.76323 type:complete len:303 (-) Transcript_35749:159-1067(-)|eukprot:CAMPEP_0183345622 /NCGR_PEP_ID=MMETSP0164_2-20130417/10997_1 /TAXON_ID=221442 /ORGANISM="Coccolithus pelagicus ssp braarudi, Strain PLY182g" /LENGTH=302 /DNA_ID=CAMNT_0025516785 /DNA_START=20 /DNA_END=928 /DNA_ORIENTATION=-
MVRLAIFLLGAHSPTLALQLPWFVKTEVFRPSFSFSEIRPHLEAHKVWVDSLRAEGTSITSGYRVDADGRPGGGGLMIFAAADYATAERLVMCDPLVANGCVDWQLDGWIADVGDVALVDGGAWYAKRAVAARAPPPTLCVASAPPPCKPRVTLDPDYRLATGIASGAGLLSLTGPFGTGIIAALPIGALAALIAARTAAVRLVFDPEALEVMTVDTDGGVLESGRENFAVGGRNRWAYDTITEWALYPTPETAVLVYFREGQSRPEGVGHLFPVLFSPEKLRQELEQRVGCDRQIMGPPSL